MARIRGNGQDNQLTGTGSADRILGRGGDDTIDAGAGNDRIFAGGGNDVIMAGQGRDIIFGGGGMDRVVFSGNREDYDVSVGDDVIRIEGPEGLKVIRGVEAFEFADVTLAAADLNNPNIGTNGDDLLLGTPGDDDLKAGDGDDTVVMSQGSDTIDGGDGFDTLVIQGNSPNGLVISDADAPGTLLFFSEEQDVFEDAPQQSYINFERIEGDDGAQYVALVDPLTGIGVSESYEIALKGGNDIIQTGLGNDTVDAGEGDDLVALFRGEDIVTLGAGNDQVGVSIEENQGTDVITDFNPAEDEFYILPEDPFAPDPDSEVTLLQRADGTLVTYATGSSVLLQGVDADELNGDNIVFSGTITEIDTVL